VLQAGVDFKETVAVRGVGGGEVGGGGEEGRGEGEVQGGGEGG